MIKFSDDDKKTVERIINIYKESLASCSTNRGLADIGYEFTALVTWGKETVDFWACNNGMKMVFFDRFYEPKEKLLNEFSPKYIRVLQRIHFIKNLYDSRLIVMNTDTCLFDVPPNDWKENVLRFHINENSITKFIKEYYRARILPTYELQELFNNNFKDEEQIRYEKQLKKANYSIWISLLGLIIAVIVPFIINACTTNTINNEQIIEMKHSIETNQKEISNRLDKLVKTTKHPNNNIKSQN